MIGIYQTEVGVLDSRSNIVVGEGYQNDYSVFISLTPELQFNAKTYPYIISNPFDSTSSFFPYTTRTISNDGYIYIAASKKYAHLNNFLTGIIGFRMIGSMGGASIEGSGVSSMDYHSPSSRVPQARDALAYNRTKYNKEIDEMINWRWFYTSGTPQMTGVFGACPAQTRQLTWRNNQNWDGFYTNIYNINPTDDDIWIYNYSTPATTTLVNRIDGTVTQLGAVNWVVSGRKSVYYNDGKPIYWKVKNYKFDTNYKTAEIYNKITQSVQNGADTQIIGLPAPNSNYLDLDYVEGGGVKVGIYGNSFKSRFLWSGNISRWVFQINTFGCRNQILGPSTTTFITGLNSAEYPWTTTWPSGITTDLYN